MNANVLINAIVNQTTVLIAQLATSAGARAPLSSIANQVFLDLIDALEAQGVRQKVVADMFGMALRTYQKKVQRLSESETVSGQSLWQAVFAYLGEEQVATRAAILARFHRDDDATLRGILRDLVDSGLAFKTGSGPSVAYRMATDDDLGKINATTQDQGASTLVWVTVYRSGPITEAELADRLRIGSRLPGLLERLIEEGRIERVGGDQDNNGATPRYKSRAFVVPLGAQIGWEAAVLDHYQAMVGTITGRLSGEAAPSEVGGSTYSFDVWKGHPHEDEVKLTLAKMRELAGDLRKRVVAYNEQNTKPSHFERVVVYNGQSITDIDASLDPGAEP